MENYSCNSCNSCYSCRNLKMTEYNYFCWSTEYNSDTSFQQPRYRVFNVEVGEEEYNKIKKIYHKLDLCGNESYENRFQTAFKKMWNTLTQEQKQEYFDIPHFNWEGFTYITGVEKEEKLELIRSKGGAMGSRGDRIKPINAKIHSVTQMLYREL